MITRLRGQLLEKQPTRVVIEDGHGVGYELAIPVSTFQHLPEPGSAVALLTQLIVREDALLLFGFGSAGERDLFRVLITISGVGPKIALAILSGIELDRFREAVLAGDTALLRTIPGIGKKMADRLAVELKDRLPAGDTPGGEREARELGCSPEVYRDTVAAMVSLGYSSAAASAAAKRALAGQEGPMAIDELLRRALAAAS
ncbi:MAG TPA: Holliday junction branch migration protein RuvA [Candidatus Udaeobacter sp.]|nr:Holliday junction branch migration protein RuvA [Candidatus Udaeobacter sp.]